MARPHLDDEDILERELLGKEVKAFMETHKFTELKMAETLGISRRSMQMLKAGRIKPHAETLKRWEIISSKYEKRAARA